jgi:hypothetical protein
MVGSAVEAFEGCEAQGFGDQGESVETRPSLLYSSSSALTHPHCSVWTTELAPAACTRLCWSLLIGVRWGDNCG